jgi:hypothetical protein
LYNQLFSYFLHKKPWIWGQELYPSVTLLYLHRMASAHAQYLVILEWNHLKLQSCNNEVSNTDTRTNKSMTEQETKTDPYEVKNLIELNKSITTNRWKNFLRLLVSFWDGVEEDFFKLNFMEKCPQKLLGFIIILCDLVKNIMNQIKRQIENWE